MKTKICLLCNKEFKKPYFKSIESWGQVKYCSIKCYGLSKRKANPIHCDNCSKEIYVKPSLLKKHKRHFCSMICRSNFVKTLPFTEQNAYKGVRKEGESKQVYHRNHCKNNRDNISHLKARRYAREKNAKGNHSLKEWQDLKLRFNNRCAKCMKSKKLTKDHIIPLSKGGTDFITNIQPLCRNCNSKKHNKIENPELIKQNSMNTIEGNKLIYKFSMPEHWEKVKNCSDSFFISFNYHRDWNQLMPVVEKINEVCKTTGYPDTQELPHLRILYTPREDVWFYVVKFIQWYNENKTL